MYRYFQLLTPEFRDLVAGNDNPANIPDCTHSQTAAAMARRWMRANGVQEAILVINDGDNILSMRDLSVN